MIRRVALGLLVLALLLAALVGVVTWQFSGLVTPQIERYLTRYGVDSLRTTEVKWRFNRLRLETIEADGTIDGNDFTLHLDNVDVGYQWWRLFSGTIDSITVGAAQVSLAVSAGEDDPPQPAQPLDLDLVPLLSGAWLEQLPAATIALEQVSAIIAVTGGPTLAVEGRDWRLDGWHLDDPSLHEKQGRLAAALTIRDQAAPGILLMLDIAGGRAEPLHISAGLSREGVPVASAGLSLAQQASGADALALAFKGEVDHINLRRTLDALRSAGHPLAAELPEDWPQPLPPVAGFSRFSGTIELAQRVRHSAVDWLLAGVLDAGFSHRVELAGWPDPALGETRLQLDYRAAGPLRQLGLVATRPLHLEGSYTLSGRELPAPFSDWREVPVRLEIAPQGPIAISAAGVTLAGAAVAAEVGSEGLMLAAKVELAAIAASADGVAGEAQVSLDLQRDQRSLLAPALTAKVEQRQGKWRLAGTVDERSWSFAGQWQAGLDEDGGYHLSLDGRAGNLAALLATVRSLEPLPLPVTLAEGEGRFRYRIAGDGAAPAQSLAFELSGMAGLVEDIAVRNASLEGTIDSNPLWHSRGDIQLRIDDVHAGIAIDDIATAVQLLPSAEFSATRWSVRSFQAAVFDGTIDLEAPFALAIPLDDHETVFKLELSNWRLGRILALYETQGLHGEGVLNGLLPVRLSAGGIHVEGGELASRQPGGSIVYDSGLSTGNQQLDMALRLLRNFEYDTLAVRADFVPSGDLTLALQLAGRNPGEFDGRAVNFNINVEENLFALLKTLQLTDEVINRLENRLRR